MFDVKCESQLKGRFKVEVFRADGTLRTQVDWFDNLILNQGLDRLGSAGGSDATWNCCQVGSGNTAPVNANTGLQSFIAGTSTVSATLSGRDDGNGYGWRRNTYEFGIGAAAGVIAELGVGWATTGAALFSRALIKDGGGNPTTITVLSDEILRVTWEVRFYWPTIDTSGSVIFTGNVGGTYNWTARAAQVTGSNWIPDQIGLGGFGIVTGDVVLYYGTVALGPITAQPTGSSQTFGCTQIAYVPGTYYKEAKTSLSLAQANYSGGIKGLRFRSAQNQYYQIVFDAIPKDGTMLCEINFRHSWARRP